MTPKLVTLNHLDGRETDIYHWQADNPGAPTLIFSHGFESSPFHYHKLLGPLASSGFEIIAPLHTDSKNHPQHGTFDPLHIWQTRIEDLHHCIEHFSVKEFVAAGHSYGALTALCLGGVTALRPQGLTVSMCQPGTRAVLAFSPPPALPNFVSMEDYAKLSVPALIQTGTKDIVPGMQTEPDQWRDHLAAFNACEPGAETYALVLDEVDHCFGGAICEPAPELSHQSTQLHAALKIATEFLHVYGGVDGSNQTIAMDTLKNRLHKNGELGFYQR